MKLLTLILSFLLCFTGLNAQSLDSLKHIEIVTELQDSMALINKSDINIINKVFYERDILDSLNSVNDTIIRNLKLQHIEKDSLIANYTAIIQNDFKIKLEYQSTLDEKNSQLIENQKAIKKQKTGKTIWQSTTGALAIALIIILCL